MADTFAYNRDSFIQQVHLHTTETFAYSRDICRQQGNRERRSGIFDKCIKLKWSHILLFSFFLGYKLTQKPQLHEND